MDERQNPNRRTLPDGFTLIELLVVISIISMMMSIMLPGLSRAKEQANRLVCSSNLRQLTICWTLYAFDNNDGLCSPDTGSNNPFLSFRTNHWVAEGPYIPRMNLIGGSERAIKNGVLWPYTQSVELYKCKSDGMGRLRSYSISSTMAGPVRPAYNILTEIPRPAERMVFIGAFTYGGPGGERMWLNNAFGIDTYRGAAKFTWYNNQSITIRHTDGCNVSFADTHTEYLKWKDRRTVKWVNGQITAARASQNNSDLERLYKAYIKY